MSIFLIKQVVTFFARLFQIRSMNINHLILNCCFKLKHSSLFLLLNIYIFLLYLSKI